MTKLQHLLACSLLLAAPLPALAETLYNQVSLRAEVSREIAQDRMLVTLYTEAENSDPAKLAAEVTNTLNQAIKTARGAKGVVVSQGRRSSYPVYGKEGRRIVAWRERAELQLESTDFPALSRLTADLLGSLQMASMGFSVSDAIRAQSEDAMIEEAVAAFRARADIATRALGGKGYKIIALNLNGGGVFHPVMRSVGMKAEYADAMPTPEIEAGTQRMSVSADGTIEVQIP